MSSWHKHRAAIVVLLVLTVSTGVAGWLLLPEKDLLGDPVVRDWEEILESDTLRVITRNHPLTFYLYRGTRRGFDFELINKFAEDNGLIVDVVIPPKWVDMYSWLYQGKGDVIASNMTITPERSRIIQFTQPYMKVHQVAVGTDESKPPQNIKDFEGKTVLVRRGSSYAERLRELRSQGLKITIEYFDEENFSEDPVQSVAQGKYPLTILDNTIAHLEQHFYPGLEIGASISEDQQIAWGVRPNSNKLHEVLNDFLQEQDRSAFFNVLKKRYFENKSRFLRHRSAQIAQHQNGKLSQYDAIFQLAESETELDWLLIAAQSYHESRFYPDKVSWAGAVGLMQLMPRTAKSMGVENIYDPHENILAGAKYLKYLQNHYDSSVRDEESIRFALAAYNAGMGHIENARKLAVERGGNPDSWSDVAISLSLLERPEFYQKEGYAFVRGRSVRRYVADVLHRYQIFQDLNGEEERILEDEGTVVAFKRFQDFFNPMLAALR